MDRLKNILCGLFLLLGLSGEIYGLQENLAEATVAITPGTNDLIISAIGFGSVFTSTDQTITASTIYTVAHGLGGVPVWTHAYIRNTTTEAGYSVGDRVPVTFNFFNGVGIGHTAANGTNIYYALNGMFVVVNRSSTVVTTITPGNWVLVLQAWK